MNKKILKPYMYQSAWGNWCVINKHGRCVFETSIRLFAKKFLKYSINYNND